VNQIKIHCYACCDPQLHIYGPGGTAGLCSRVPYDQFFASDFKEVTHDQNM